MLPDYLFVGPTKSGTTWIDSYLRGRKDVVLPSGLKETFYFDKRFDRGLSWYESLFDHGDRSAVCVEVAPSLFAKPTAAARTAATLPNASVICTLRNPVDRAVSHYFHYVSSGRPSVSFDEMVSSYPDVVGSGVYYKNIINWINLFGRARAHVLLYDDMVHDLNGYCQTICSVLGIPFEAPGAEIVAANVNAASVPRIRVLARLARVGANRLRGMGAGRAVDLVNANPVKRFVFGSAPAPDHKRDIRRQALERYDELSEGIDALEELLDIDLSSWKRPTAPESAAASAGVQL